MGSRFEFGTRSVSYSVRTDPLLCLWAAAVVLRALQLIPGRWWVFVFFPVMYVCAVFLMVFILHLACKVQVDSVQPPDKEKDK